MPNNNFWNDDLVREYLTQNCMININHPYQIQLFENFKKSKESKLDFEILSFKGKPKHFGDGKFFLLKSDGDFYDEKSEMSVSLHSLLNMGHSVKSGHIEIFSVKRLSDNQIFTIGDVIELHGQYPTGTIDRFEINTFDSKKISACNKSGYGVGLNRWKKVNQTEPLNYEILSFQQEYSGMVWVKSLDGFFYAGDYGAHLPEISFLEERRKDNTHRYFIASVRRISDNVIFRVGDYVRYNKTVANYPAYKISSFRLIVGDGIEVVGEDGKFGEALDDCDLAEAPPTRKLLGTTHDGKECFEGDNFPIWMTSYRNGVVDGLILMDVRGCQWASNKEYFADKDKGMEFVSHHSKVKVSYDELKSFLIKNDVSESNYALKILPKFFKTKIQTLNP